MLEHERLDHPREDRREGLTEVGEDEVRRLALGAPTPTRSALAGSTMTTSTPGGVVGAAPHAATSTATATPHPLTDVTIRPLWRMAGR